MEEQAERMLAASRQRFEEAKVGQSVVVPIADVDRGRLNSRNLMAVVIEINDGLYKLATKDGVLDRLYVRSELELCEQPFLNIDEIPSTSKVTSRAAAGLASISGNRQGFVKCNCKTKCTNNQCNCKKKKVLCNSKCHSSLSCCKNDND